MILLTWYPSKTVDFVGSVTDVKLVKDLCARYAYWGILMAIAVLALKPFNLIALIKPLLYDKTGF